MSTTSSQPFPSKVFVVVRATYEYNDEYYHFPEEDTAGIPTNVLLSRADAEKLADELNTLERSKKTPDDFYAESWDSVPDFYNVFEVPVLPVR